MRTWNDTAEKIRIDRFGKDTVLPLATSIDNIPYVRYVNTYYEDGMFYVITNALSGKMQQIAKNPVVAICREWFTAYGIGKNLGYFGKPKNKAIAQKLRTVFSTWIDNGHNNFADRNTVILRIQLTGGTLFSHGTRYDL